MHGRHSHRDPGQRKVIGGLEVFGLWSAHPFAYPDGMRICVKQRRRGAVPGRLMACVVLLAILVGPGAVGAADAVGRVAFATDVVPILTKLGCNSGGCHGKSTGQNGFKLSLLGFVPSYDHESMVKEARGRRVFAGDPDSSLLLAAVDWEQILRITRFSPTGFGRGPPRQRAMTRSWSS